MGRPCLLLQATHVYIKLHVMQVLHRALGPVVSGNQLLQRLHSVFTVRSCGIKNSGGSQVLNVRGMQTAGLHS
jgi:hypothetical protein